MIPRIASLKPISDLLLQVEFDDGITVLYDVKEDLSRTCVYWTEDIDLPSDTIYEYGKKIRDNDS